MNQRRKGLAKVRQVKKILESRGCIVEGPGYRPVFANGKMMATHKDYFDAYDLLYIAPNSRIIGVQVCEMKVKSRNCAKLHKLGISGELWCYEGNHFNRYEVYDNNGEMMVELMEEDIWLC